MRQGCEFNQHIVSGAGGVDGVLESCNVVNIKHATPCKPMKSLALTSESAALIRHQIGRNAQDPWEGSTAAWVEPRSRANHIEPDRGDQIMDFVWTTAPSNSERDRRVEVALVERLEGVRIAGHSDQELLVSAHLDRSFHHHDDLYPPQFVECNVRLSIHGRTDRFGVSTKIVTPLRRSFTRPVRLPTRANPNQARRHAPGVRRFASTPAFPVFGHADLVVEVGPGSDVDLVPLGIGEGPPVRRAGIADDASARGDRGVDAGLRLVLG